MDETKLAEAIDLFQNALPDFKSFAEPGEAFTNEELAYKLELSEAFQTLGEKLLLGEGDQFLPELRGLLNRKLEATGAPQNLVSWRDIAALYDPLDTDQLSPSTATQRIRELLAATDDSDHVWQAVDKLASFLAEGGLAAAQTKIWPSLLLFLWRPEHYIFIKPSFFDKVLERLGIEKLGSDVQLDGESYERVMRAMRELRDRLSLLEAKSYIDVQSFLWKVGALKNSKHLVDRESLRPENVWLLRVSRDQLDDEVPLSLFLNWSAEERLSDFYRECIESRFMKGDVLLFLDDGCTNRVLGEGTLSEFTLEGKTLKVTASDFVNNEAELTTKTNFQLITPGIVEGFGQHAVQAEALCREYFDQFRSTYLIGWNPDIQGEGSASNDVGQLAYKVGDRTDWACVNKSIRTGDPVYLGRVGSRAPKGLIAKGRACSGSHTAEHWNPAKAGKLQDFVLIRFEDIRDGPADSCLPLDDLREKFPNQHWSPQSSGVLIQDQYRVQLHEEWKRRDSGLYLRRVFEEWQALPYSEYFDWIPRYREIVEIVRDSRKSGEGADDELVSKIWQSQDNGIANAGRGTISKDAYEKNIESFRKLTNQIFRSPDSDTFDEVVAQLKEIKNDESSGLDKTPHLLVRRAFSAAYPERFFTIGTDHDLDRFATLLRGKFGDEIPEDRNDSWIEKNAKLRSYLLSKGILENDLAVFNTFGDYLYKRLQKEPNAISKPPVTKPLTAKNLILYGPPGTGKTYTLKNEYFPQYTSKVEAVSREEWLVSVLSDMNWREVIAAALHNMSNTPTSVTDLVKHEYMKVKSLVMGRARPSNAATWSTLQLHSSADCENVKVSRRNDPGWFWKDENSLWTLAGDWQDTEEEVADFVAKLEEQPHDSESSIQRYEFVTFHQSYSYEEFVEGIRPTLGSEDENTGELSYVLKQGVFRRICERARSDRDGNRYALFIDEINRGNISKILGELITLIEDDKRQDATNELSVVLPYSGDSFSVPGNLDIYGTMNTADRSLAHIDTALRRRFTFTELMPKPDLLQPTNLAGKEINLRHMLETLNSRIEALFDREHMIGHAYFLRGNGETVDGSELPDIFQNKIIPLLTEYFFDDWSKVRVVLADDRARKKDQQFVSRREVSEDLVSQNSGLRNRDVYQLNPDALSNPDAYRKIYSTADSDD